MEKTARKRSQKAGLPPGTLVHVGKPRTDKVRITVIDYSGDEFLEEEVASVEKCCAFRDTSTATWINVDGVHDVDLVREIGEAFKLHPLLLEDVVSTNQRPKAEDYGEHLFTVLKMLYTGDEGGVEAEQVSLVIGPHFLISFQEREGDVFEGIRDRIRRAKGRVRSMGTDYLAYALIDAVVDNYFAILEGVGEKIENLEEELALDPGPKIQGGIRQLKREAYRPEDSGRYPPTEAGGIHASPFGVAASRGHQLTDARRVPPDRRRDATLSPGRLRPHHSGGRHGRDISGSDRGDARHVYDRAEQPDE